MVFAIGMFAVSSCAKINKSKSLNHNMNLLIIRTLECVFVGRVEGFNKLNMCVIGYPPLCINLRILLHIFNSSLLVLVVVA